MILSTHLLSHPPNQKRKIQIQQSSCMDVKFPAVSDFMIFFYISSTDLKFLVPNSKALFAESHRVLS